jgi:hypothetical protein
MRDSSGWSWRGTRLGFWPPELERRALGAGAWDAVCPWTRSIVCLARKDELLPRSGVFAHGRRKRWQRTLRAESAGPGACVHGTAIGARLRDAIFTPPIEPKIYQIFSIPVMPNPDLRFQIA